MDAGELEPRVTALEGQVRDLKGRVQASEQDAAAARVLAGAADRDVGEIRAEMRDLRRATVGSINALREDIVDLRTYADRRFSGVAAQLDEIVGKFNDMSAETTAKFGIVAAGQQQIVGMLETLIDRRGEAG